VQSILHNINNEPSGTLILKVLPYIKQFNTSMGKHIPTQGRLANTQSFTIRRQIFEYILLVQVSNQYISNHNN